MQVAPVHHEIAVFVPFLKAGAQVDAGNLLRVDGVDQYQGVGIEDLGLEAFHDAQAVENGVAVRRYLDAVANFADLWSTLKHLYWKPLACQCQGCAKPADAATGDDER